MDTSLWSLAKTGDSASRGRIIEMHAEMATRIARGVRPPQSSYVEREDLESAAMLGLIDAVDRFQPERGVPFEAYAVLRIKGAIIDELRRTSDYARGTKPEDMAARISLDQMLAEDQLGLAAPDDMAARHDDEDLLKKVTAALQELPARERELMTHYYTSGLTLREAGERMGVTEARACQIHGKAVEGIRLRLGMREATTAAA